MKNILKYSIAVSLFFAATSMYAQEGPGKKVIVNGNDLYQHGYNKAHTTAPVDPREAVDSLTITSQVNYFVLPDKGVSPNWYDAAGNIKNITNTSDLKSTFGWTIDNAKGTVTASTTPIVSITWTALGADNVNAKETPTAGAACAGNARTIPVLIIKQPELKFNQKAGAYTDEACHTAADVAAGITYNFPVDAATQSHKMDVTYTVAKDGAAHGAAITVRIAAGTPSVLPIEFTAYGKYEVKITNVTDHTSRKTKVNGIVPADLAPGKIFTYTLTKPAETGPIYRIPNNY